MFEKNIEALEQLQIEVDDLKFPPEMNYQMPSPSFAELHGEFLDYKRGKELVVSFFTDRKYSNPQGTFQGGMISACFDDTFGPLAVFASKKPVVTIDMNIQYVRPVVLEDTFYIRAYVVSNNKTLMFLRAEAFNKKNKLLAQASTNILIYKK